MTTPDIRWIQRLENFQRALATLQRAIDLEVDVVAMGDDTDADFPAIYGDLFSDKTFDPSSGGWIYAVQDSYGLPEFDG